uniref:Zinc knuckle family protein n=1 Tax=Solanum tuberosum TaxID=4113 RepID=M1D974_SOLTU
MGEPRVHLVSRLVPLVSHEGAKGEQGREDLMVVSDGRSHGSLGFEELSSSKIEESKLKKERAREKKRSRVDNDGSERHGRSKNRQKFSGQGYSNAPKYKDERVSTPRSQGKGSESLWPTCSRCGKRHEGKCLAGRDGCYGCGESGHMKKDFPKAKATIREGKQVASSCGDDEPLKRNRFYALQSKDD